MPTAEEVDRARRELEVFLRQAQGFRLALALHNDPVERDGFIKSIAAELEKSAIKVLILDLHQPSPQRTLLARVRETLQQSREGQPVIMMVVNLEGCVEYNPELHSSGGSDTEFLATANLQRDRFPVDCPAPVVIWMTELLERAFVKQAPDLWHWRSHVIDLRTRQVPVDTISTDGQPLRNDDHRLHPKVRIDRLEEELAAYRKAGSRRDEMRVLNNIGLARHDAGEARLAKNDFEAVLNIAQELKDRYMEGTALGNLGNTYSLLGDIRKAADCYGKALEIGREIGDKQGEGNALGNLGLVSSHLGQLHKAIDFYKQQLAIHREISDKRGEGNALGNLGVAYRGLGDLAKALEFYEQALAIDRGLGDRRGEAADFGNMGLVHGDLGDIRKSIEFHEKALSIDREIGNRRGEGNALGNLGANYARLRDLKKAMEYFDQQLAITREIGDRLGQGNSLWNSAMLFAALGNRDEAVALAEAALLLFEEMEHPSVSNMKRTLVKLKEGKSKG